MFMQ